MVLENQDLLLKSRKIPKNQEYDLLFVSQDFLWQVRNSNWRSELLNRQSGIPKRQSGIFSPKLGFAGNQESLFENQDRRFFLRNTQTSGISTSVSRNLLPRNQEFRLEMPKKQEFPIENDCNCYSGAIKIVDP